MIKRYFEFLKICIWAYFAVLNLIVLVILLSYFILKIIDFIKAL
jgi:hypothetical protein